MLRQLDFVNKICANFTYWNTPVVIAAAIVRYHKFMKLMQAKKNNTVGLVPTVDIDLFAPSYAAWTQGNLVQSKTLHCIAKRLWRNFGRVPSVNCRFVGVDEALPSRLVLPHAATADDKAMDASAIAIFASPPFDHGR
ncbi:Aste57867_10402 [Aphanomyces stellatus]|uniref:Aste57867_10402 protein n=1 Tax=Aphanomyces stellatus TaxID=120398 RepID=A0A485KQT2_9STRA|nr:hypothetical protein As57867_010362 [Aphanomyces stellatus]VFT87276.1 Aste57867_10402 [Aphanomyces stellatus]